MTKADSQDRETSAGGQKSTRSSGIFYWIEALQTVRGRERVVARTEFEVVSPIQCAPEVWKNLDTRQSTYSGLGLREPPLPLFYGMSTESPSPVFPSCPHFSRPVRIPVLMVDWEDFDPLQDPATEGDPSRVLQQYGRSTPEELGQYLNGSGGVATYFQDVSGGQARVLFAVYGWLESSAPGSYLRPRSDYVFVNPYTGQSECARNEVFLDAMRDAVAYRGVDMRRYDADANGMLDGAVLVYEGAGGLCGASLNGAGDTFDGYASPPEFDFIAGYELVPSTDPNAPQFSTQQIWINYFNTMGERAVNEGLRFEAVATWHHELGHLLIGFPDYYNFVGRVTHASGWALSASYWRLSSQPAAFEKWLFGLWISPAEVTSTATYELQANEIPDGTSYTNGPYLLAWNIDGDPLHLLMIENRWFDSAGNTLTRWAPANGRESGLAIFEFNRHVDSASSSPLQLERFWPGGPSMQGLGAFGPGESFQKCYSSQCIRVSDIGPPGARVAFPVAVAPPMKVARIGTNSASGDLACAAASKGRVKGFADIQIVDRNTGLGVARGWVEGQWSGAVSQTVQGATDVSGRVLFYSDPAPPGSSFTFTVALVDMWELPPAYLHDAAADAEKSDSTLICGH